MQEPVDMVRRKKMVIVHIDQDEEQVNADNDDDEYMLMTSTSVPFLSSLLNAVVSAIGVSNFFCSDPCV